MFILLVAWGVAGWILAIYSLYRWKKALDGWNNALKGWKEAVKGLKRAVNYIKRLNKE